MTLEKALKMVEVEYENAKKLERIYHPLAYALYKVWKVVDRERIASKPPTDLTNKCGSCEYAKPTSEFGKSNCYICCTNKNKHWQHRTSQFKQRTNPACKLYKVKENSL